MQCVQRAHYRVLLSKIVSESCGEPLTILGSRYCRFDMRYNTSTFLLRENKTSLNVVCAGKYLCYRKHVYYCIDILYRRGNAFYGAIQ